MKKNLLFLLLCPLLINAGACGSKCMKPQASNAVAPSVPANDPQNLTHYFMPLNPDNERVVDLKLTMQIVTDDDDVRNILPVNDKRLIATYYAFFKQCKNGVSNLAPENWLEHNRSYQPSAYLNSKNIYKFTSVIQSVDFQQYTESSVRVAYTIEKNGKKRENDVKLTIDHDMIPMHGIDPINKKQFLLLFLSEIEKK